MSDDQKKTHKIMLRATIAVAVIETSLALISLHRTSWSIAIGAIVASSLIWKKMKRGS